MKSHLTLAMFIAAWLMPMQVMAANEQEHAHVHAKEQAVKPQSDAKKNEEHEKHGEKDKGPDPEHKRSSFVAPRTRPHTAAPANGVRIFAAHEMGSNAFPTAPRDASHSLLRLTEERPVNNF